MSDRPQAATAPTAGFHEAANNGRGQAWLAAGSLLGALAASTCCILPVVLFSLGISGAWIANFTQLAPYKPYFIVVTLAFLGAGYWLTHRASKVACADGAACTRPLPNRIVKSVLTAAAVSEMVTLAARYKLEGHRRHPAPGGPWGESDDRVSVALPQTGDQKLSLEYGFVCN
jgi:mercuric ion transport protein